MLSVHETLPPFLLEQSRGARVGGANSSSSCLPLVWPVRFTLGVPGRRGSTLLRGTEGAGDGLTGEFGSGSYVGSSLLVLLVPGCSCVSGSYFHFI